MAERVAIGVDLGATRIRVCLGNSAGKILRRETHDMVHRESLAEYLEELVAAVGALAGKISKSDLQGVCVASPGPLDLKEGSIVRSSNIPFPKVPVIKELRDGLGVDAYLVNDANAAALGEWLRGAGVGRQNVFYVTISTGIGGGAVADGRLLLGKDGNAAEIGHTVVDSTGRMKCGCGRLGHWEAYCSGSGIPAFARSIWDKTAESERSRSASLFGGSSLPGAKQVFDSAARGDPFASKVVEEVGRLNAIGVANITDAFDPEIVTIGGGVGLNNADAILSPIRKHLGEYAINRVPEVRITPLGDDAGLLGALSVAFDPGLIGM
jgi:glucokinase